MQTVRTHNETETIDFARQIGKSLKSKDVLTLQGDLGSGKTTFTKGLAQGLGLLQPITSPTFLIVKQYEVKQKNLHTLYHIDLYRLEDNADLNNIGFEDILSDPHGVTVIEWPERLKKPIIGAIEIAIKHIKDDEREITIKETK